MGENATVDATAARANVMASSMVCGPVSRTTSSNSLRGARGAARRAVSTAAMFANLKNSKRRLKAQLATLMGAEETKDEHFELQLERFRAWNEELKQMKSELRKMATQFLLFLDAAAECVHIGANAPELHDKMCLKRFRPK